MSLPTRSGNRASRFSRKLATPSAASPEGSLLHHSRWSFYRNRSSAPLNASDSGTFSPLP